MKNALDVFVAKERIARFWFLAFVVVLGVSIWDRQRLVAKLTQKPLFFAVDGADTYYVSSLADFESARSVHDDITRMAAECLFNRNPKGSDYHERMRRLFTNEAFAQANKWLAKDAAFFKEQSVHQKIELGQVTILQTTQDTILTSVAGQVIRQGVFEKQPYTDVFQGEVLFKCVLNRDMRSNGRYPVVVVEFEPRLKKIGPGETPEKAKESTAAR